MWNGSNEEAVRKAYTSGKLPFDGDYGAYIAREMLALGFKVKQVTLASTMAFVFSVDLFDGKCKELVICKSSATPLAKNTVQTLASIRAMQKADKYVIVTNTTLMKDAERFAAANGIVIVDEFLMGDEVLNIVDKGGLVPQTLLMLFAQTLTRNAELEQRLSSVEAAARASEARMVQAAQAAAKETKPAKGLSRSSEDSPMERYAAGKMDPSMGRALLMVSRMDAVSTATLARKLRVSQERAAVMLNDMEALGVVTAAEAGRPRFVRMTQGVIERTFGVHSDGQELI